MHNVPWQTRDNKRHHHKLNQPFILTRCAMLALEAKLSLYLGNTIVFREN